MIDAIRKEKRMDDVEYIQENKHFHHQQYSDLNEILEKALNKIPEHQKRIILLRDYEGYSYKEIGEIAGMTEPQVKINIYRGRLALKEYLKSVETLV
jgi:RNA polymerase sigma-70 factor (ECF subfamily)